MAGRSSVLVGATEAARLCSTGFCPISPQLIIYRANAGKLRVARRHPLRFRLDDILEALPRMRTKGHGGRRTEVDTLTEKVLHG